MTVTGALRRAGLRDSYLHAASLGSVGLCVALWIRAKTVDQDERGNAERRALFVGLWPPMFWLIGDSLREPGQVRGRLLAGVDEAAALDGLRGRDLNYDPARAPQDGRADGHWHVDAATTAVGREPPGPPVPGGAWETACRLAGEYEFADGPILRAVYRGGGELLGRDMLLEARFCGLRFYLGVRVTGVTDGTRDTPDGTERVWGWSYQTLQGHLEQGRLAYEVAKNLRTGVVSFSVTGYSRAAPIPSPLLRWGFRLFGRWSQRRFYRNVQRRMYRLVQSAGRGQPLPAPAVRPDGLVLAPSGARLHPLERLARGWLHAGG